MITIAFVFGRQATAWCIFFRIKNRKWRSHLPLHIYWRSCCLNSRTFTVLMFGPNAERATVCPPPCPGPGLRWPASVVVVVGLPTVAVAA